MKDKKTYWFDVVFYIDFEMVIMMTLLLDIGIRNMKFKQIQTDSNHFTNIWKLCKLLICFKFLELNNWDLESLKSIKLSKFLEIYIIRALHRDDLHFSIFKYCLSCEKKGIVFQIVGKCSETTDSDLTSNLKKRNFRFFNVIEIQTLHLNEIQYICLNNWNILQRTFKDSFSVKTMDGYVFFIHMPEN